MGRVSLPSNAHPLTEPTAIPGDPPFLRNLSDDGLYLPEVKPHSLDKIRIHNAYAARFTSSMYRKWPQMAYIGLYSGAGRAKVTRPAEIIETTAMGVFRLPHRFTKYIFVDNDPRCIAALRTRIERVPGPHDMAFVEGDTAAVVPQVLRELPQFSRSEGLISFCFVDPFAADLKFETIRALSGHKMDFLILLMLGGDVRRNQDQYLNDESSTRIAELVDCQGWRSEFRAMPDQSIVRFLLGKFDAAMVRLGFRSADEQMLHQISAAGTSVLQYVLVFYSRHPLAQKFWKDILSSAPPQRSLDLG